MMEQDPQLHAHSHYGRLRRTLTLLTASIALGSCTPAESTREATVTTDTNPATLDIYPEYELIPTPGLLSTESSLDCEENNSTVFEKGSTVLMAADTPRIEPDMRKSIVDLINATTPEASPREFSQKYLEAAQLILEDSMVFDLDIILDPTLNLDKWDQDLVQSPDPDQEADTSRKDAFQDYLSSSLTVLIEEMARYPAGLYTELGIDKVRLADIYEAFGGHYNTANNEILVEYDLTGYSRSWFNTLFVHELAHAYHDRYCGGFAGNDPELTKYNSIDYIGYPEDVAQPSTDGESPVQTLDPSFYSYGSSREFFSMYGASSAYEDFATTVEYTLTKRGLIQAGDDDYNSPLYHKQQLVVERLETMMPGTKAFLEKHTALLRLSPTNEIFGSVATMPWIDMNIDDLHAIIKSTAEGKLVINGVYYSSPSIMQDSVPYPKLISRPVLGYDEYNGKKYISLPYFSEGYPEPVVQLISDLNTNGIIVFVPSKDIVDNEYVGELFTTLPAQDSAENDLPLNSKIDMNILDATSTLHETISQDFKPVYISLIN